MTRLRRITTLLKLGARSFWRYLRTLGIEEWALLFVLLCVVGGTWAFIEVADEVMEEEAQQFDEMVLSAMREPGDLSVPRGPEWLAKAARDITSLGSTSVLLLVIILVLGYLAMRRRWWVALFVAASAGSGTALAFLMKDLFQRPRPSLFEHLDQVNTYSFPSAHAMLAAVVYLTLGALLSQSVRQHGLRLYFLTVALTLTLLVGLSRVYVGVHHPTDVLAGWAAGLAWANLCWLAMAYAQWRQRKGATGIQNTSKNTNHN